MNNKRVLIALAVFLLPIIGRLFWFYQGVPIGNRDVTNPELGSIDLPEPRYMTPESVSYTGSSVNATILIDLSHENLFTLAEIEPLHSELLLRGASVITAESNADFLRGLQKATAIMLITPTDPFSDEEIEAVEEFNSRGGKLLVIADPTRSNAEHIDDKAEKIIQINQLLQPFGLSFNNDYVYNLHENEGNFRNVYVQPAKFTELTADVTKLVFYGSHSVDRFGKSVIYGDENMVSSLTDDGDSLSVAALNADETVFAIGDLTFMTNPFHQVEDNFKFIQNITSFLLNSQRVKNFYDFPDLFNKDVGILLTDGISLDKELLAVLSELQEYFARDDLRISLLEESQADLDEIILGIYPPDEVLQLLTDELGFIYEDGDVSYQPTPTLELTKTPDTNLIQTPDNKIVIAAEEPSEKSIIVPEFGSIPREGFGFLFINSDGEKNQLVLLADSQVNCVNLLKLVNSGSLSGCLIGETVAICEQDIRFNSYDDIPEETIDEDTQIFDELEEEPEITPTPFSTPQP